MTTALRDPEAIVLDVNSCGVFLLVMDGHLHAWGNLAKLPQELKERVRVQRQEIGQFLLELSR